MSSHYLGIIEPRKKAFRLIASLLLLASWESYSQNIVRAEYFFDTDPGPGNGSAITIPSPGTNVSFTANISTSSLSLGFHQLAIRVKESGSPWGEFENRGFYITNSTADVPSLTAAEYFFDNDPGIGNGTSIPVTIGANINFIVNVPTTSLSVGFHFLAVRTKGLDGKWGIFESRGFYITNSTSDVSNIVAAEYFFDNDPGAGNGTPISISSGSTVNFTTSLPITGLPTGFHFLTIRTKGLDGMWGVFESRGFYVAPIALSAGDIVAAEYFIDTDPGEDNGTALTVTTPGPTINQIFPIIITGVPSGTHKLGIRVKDAGGIWSEVQLAPFDVLSCTPPSAPVGTGASRCGVGTVTLLASGASGTKEYHWYEDEFTPTQAGTGSPFITPSLNATKNYYVSTYDPATTCESSRSLVIATVTVVGKPTLNVSGSVSFCEGNSIFLSAPFGFSDYLWSDGRTTQQILATLSGDYFVKTGDGGACFSENSDTLSVTAIAAPVKPVIQVTGSTILCGIETAVLSGPIGFQYIWSTGATSQDITVTQDGNYSLSIRNASGCQSVTSDPVTITRVTSEAAVSMDGNLLIASVGDSYQWFLNGEEIPGATRQILEINFAEFGTYAVEVTTGSCFSRSADFVYLVTDVELKIENTFFVAPNPFDHILIIKNNYRNVIPMRIEDALGRELLNRSVPTGESQIDVSFIRSGIYYVIAETSDKPIIIKIQKL
ncbi:MAG: T9SS type A sorting domain-containing protein [Chryseolinea sp.]